MKILLWIAVAIGGGGEFTKQISDVVKVSLGRLVESCFSSFAISRNIYFPAEAPNNFVFFFGGGSIRLAM